MIYSVANDTLNGAVALAELRDEILASAITVALDQCSVSEDVLTITFKAAHSVDEETILDLIVADHDGVEETVVETIKNIQNPFADKILPNGKKLYRRKHGKRQSIPGNGSGKIQFVVPYAVAKIDEVEIVNCSATDTCHLKVLDNDAGTFSTVPNYLLNQFGFDVNLSDIYYTDTSNYDAELYQSMVVEIEYFNNEAEAKDIGVNFVLHEVK